MKQGETLSVPARLDELGTLFSHIAPACTAAGFSTEERLRVELVIEELFTNTIRHGYGGSDGRQVEQDGIINPVWLTLVPVASQLQIEYQDAGMPFNPLLGMENPGDAPHAPCQVGGQGRGLIVGMPDECAYVYAHARNCLSFTFRRSPNQRPTGHKA